MLTFGGDYDCKVGIEDFTGSIFKPNKYIIFGLVCAKIGYLIRKCYRVGDVNILASSVF